MRIWVDIDNSPHVPFFSPILKELKQRGHEVIVTSRQYAQTRELLENHEIEFLEVGEHAGKSKLKKVLNVIQRANHLKKAVQSFKPEVAVSHGSRAQSIAAWMLGIPKLLLFDYEWTEMHIFKRFSTLMACPTALTDDVLQRAGLPIKKIKKYHGFKEELYLPSLQPDHHFRSSLEIPDNAIFVVIRPSSMTSNYHDALSEEILTRLLLKVKDIANVMALVVPRTEVDRRFTEKIIAEQNIQNVKILKKAVPGLQLLYWADVVVSGGGTMNRESALLGTPTYSMFTGARPAIDQVLQQQGTITFIETPQQVDSIEFQKVTRKERYTYEEKGLPEEISNMIEQLVKKSF
ncbi:protein of unknown function DUF354 [Chloroherpeton thalassium ATCC 35110]|uniref:DUF354 domain-containing protein n=1 Tax=Chloroherpeton thalassium (strain ATCC 35110 / GB-78) TaxID=517418 RepID=B3QU36_CHLT3|nr:DUF354 domain-containing protein [Chloroherpeton thalassium]ACF12834.1 protein of unknown function DUF354 [Chloroherpeton thalassium ATCC 35110]